MIKLLRLVWHAFLGFGQIGLSSRAIVILVSFIQWELVLQWRSCSYFQPKYWGHLIASLVAIFIVKFFTVNDCSIFWLVQNRSDAQKALNKNGMQINGVLIVGVKPLDPMQRQALNERLNNQGFMTLPPPSSRTSELNTSRASPRPYYLQNGSTNARQSGGAIASPSKSVVSKIMDLMFGL